jgi:hypothetical protein
MERAYESFSRYVEEYMQCDRHTIDRIIELSQIAQLIEGAGLRLPANETLLRELTKLEPERQKIIWQAITEGFESDEITPKIVRIAVEQELKRQSSPSAPETKEQKIQSGVRTALDMDNGEKEEGQTQEAPAAQPKAVAPGRITLTQEGEDALDRIRALCGDRTAEGIEKGYVSISERELIKWADQSDVTVRNLQHYICELRWSVRKALDYEERIIDGESTLNQLIVLARARGGRAIIEHQDYNELYKITIERTKILQA